MKKILINGLLLNKEFSGVQYYIENLLHELNQKVNPDLYIEIILSKGYSGSLNENEFFKIKTVEFNTQNRFARIYFENVLLPKYFTQNGFDLYHSPSYVLPYFANIPSVVTVHDLIALDFPTLCQNETAVYFNLFLPRSLAKSLKISAVSNTVKKDIITKFPNIAEDKVEVIYHGVHERFTKITDITKLTYVKLKYNLPPNFILFVGNLEPKKNLSRIIESFAALKKDRLFEHKLVIVGKKGWKFGSIFKLIKKYGLGQEVLFLGYVDEVDLPVIYSLADLLLFPSIYEGFGIPVLEAMACGCPVIVSDRGALPEVSGNICPQVNPYSVSEITQCILRLLSDDVQRNFQVRKGLVWSQNFKWITAAEKTISLYHSILLQKDV